MSEHLRFKAVMASVKMCATQGLLDLSKEDLEFLMSERLWVANERSRVRRAVESVVYGALDTVGLPRFRAPAEYIAGAIISYVHPNNYLAACTVMDGCEFTENIIEGIDAPLKATEIFSLVVQVASGNDSRLETLFKYHQENVKELANG